MASQIIQLPASAFIRDNVFFEWNNININIDASLGGGSLTGVIFTYTGNENNRGVTLKFSQDLSNAFETNGFIILLVNNSVRSAVSNGDTSAPYFWQTNDFGGIGYNLRDESNHSVSASLYISDGAPIVPVGNTITLPAMFFGTIVDGIGKALYWSSPISNFIQVPSSIIAGGGLDYTGLFLITNEITSFIFDGTGIDLDFDAGSLTEDFKTYGGITIEAGGQSLAINMNEATVRYGDQILPNNTAEITSFINSLITNEFGTLSATVTFDDGSTIAPTGVINTIATGGEGTSIQLGLTLSGGKYDTLSYVWSSPSGGSFDDSSSATPTWTRPLVDSDTAVTVRCQIQAQGTGTNAALGTQDISNLSISTTVTDILPNAIAPTVNIDAIANGIEGTEVNLSVAISGGTYDTLGYFWTTTQGTLLNETTTTPTWTRPAVSTDTDFTINLTITAFGNGTIAAAGTSDTSNDSETARVIARLVASNQQILSLPASRFLVFGSDTTRGVQWILPEGSYIAIIDGLTPGNNTRLFRRIVFRHSGQVQFYLEPAQSRASGAYDLSDTFESQGQLRITAGGQTVTFNIDGADTTEPYSWTPSNSSEITSFVEALHGNGTGSTAAEFTIADGEILSNVTAPSININTIAEGVEGTNIVLSATVSGGTYDELEYSWEITGGSATGFSFNLGNQPFLDFNNVKLENVVFEPTQKLITFENDALPSTLQNGGFKLSTPDITTPDIDLTDYTWTEQSDHYSLPSSNTGLEAFRVAVLRATDAERDQGLVAKVSPGTVTEIPDATAPTATVNAISNGNEGTTVTLGTTISGGTYDTIAYKWFLGTNTSVETNTTGLSDSTIANPVWTRPSVTAQTAYQLNCKITVTGDGTNAKDGTTASVVASASTQVNDVSSDTDVIYQNSATQPAQPTGGTTNANHIPTGWSRTRTTVPSGQLEYRSSRTRNYLNGTFTSATNWSAVYTVGPSSPLSLPSGMINTIPQGDEGTSVNISFTLSGGNYDGVSYTLSDGTNTITSGTALPTTTSWTRPQVSSQTSYTITLALTVTGNGTNAPNNHTLTQNYTTTTIVNDLTTDTDTIYISATSAPTQPTGGTTDVIDLPTGWSRTEPTPGTGETVYKSERTRNYRNGTFYLASAWGTVEVHSSHVPDPIAAPNFYMDQNYTYNIDEGQIHTHNIIVNNLGNYDTIIFQFLVNDIVVESFNEFQNTVTWTAPEVSTRTDYILAAKCIVTGTGINAPLDATAESEVNFHAFIQVNDTRYEDDFIYILGSTTPVLPDSPTSSLTDEDHLPTGWSRTAPAPTDTQNVYSCQRTLFYRNDSFVSATAWTNVIFYASLQLSLSDWTTPANHEEIVLALVEVERPSNAPARLTHDPIQTIGTGNDLDVSANLKVQRILELSSGETLWMFRSGTDNFSTYFASSGTYPDAKLFVQTDTDTVIEYEPSVVSTSNMQWGILDDALASNITGLASGDRFILAILNPVPATMHEAGDINYSYSTSEANGIVKEDYNVIAGNIAYSFLLSEVSATVPAGVSAINYSYELSTPSIRRLVAHRLSAGDINYSYLTSEANPQVTYRVSVGDINYSYSLSDASQEDVINLKRTISIPTTISRRLTRRELVNAGDINYSYQLSEASKDSIINLRKTVTASASLTKTLSITNQTSLNKGISISTNVSAAVQIITVPEAPAKPTVTSSENSVTVMWVAPNANNSPITHYTVRYKDVSTTAWTTHPNNIATTSDVITGLNAAVTYHFQVRAVNNIGNSAWSPTSDNIKPIGVSVDLSKAITAGSLVSTAFWNIQVTSGQVAPNKVTTVDIYNGDGEVRLYWEAPTSTQTITGYYIRFRRINTNNWHYLNHRIVIGKRNDPKTTRVVNLTNGLTYEFQVSAYSSGGEGPPSDIKIGSPSQGLSVPSYIKHLFVPGYSIGTTNRRGLAEYNDIVWVVISTGVLIAYNSIDMSRANNLDEPTAAFLPEGHFLEGPIVIEQSTGRGWIGAYSSTRLYHHMDGIFIDSTNNNIVAFPSISFSIYEPDFDHLYDMAIVGSTMRIMTGTRSASSSRGSVKIFTYNIPDFSDTDISRPTIDRSRTHTFYNTPKYSNMMNYNNNLALYSEDEEKINIFNSSYNIIDSIDIDMRDISDFGLIQFTDSIIMSTGGAYDLGGKIAEYDSTRDYYTNSREDYITTDGNHLWYNYGFSSASSNDERFRAASISSDGVLTRDTSRDFVVTWDDFDEADGICCDGNTIYVISARSMRAFDISTTGVPVENSIKELLSFPYTGFLRASAANSNSMWLFADGTAYGFDINETTAPTRNSAKDLSLTGTPAAAFADQATLWIIYTSDLGLAEGYDILNQNKPKRNIFKDIIIDHKSTLVVDSGTTDGKTIWLQDGSSSRRLFGYKILQPFDENIPVLQSINDINGEEGIEFSFTLPLPVNGNAPFTFQATNLPPGLTLLGRSITGTPTTPGTYSVTYTVADFDGDTASTFFNIKISHKGVVTIDDTSPFVSQTIIASLIDADGGVSNTVWQWYRGNEVITGASNSSYTPSSEDIGFRLQARVTYNDNSGNDRTAQSAFTELVIEPPPPDRPDPPTLTRGDHRINVSWTAGTDIVSYEIQYKKTSDENFSPWAHTTLATSNIITGLENGVEYEVRIRQSDSYSPSAWSFTNTAIPANRPSTMSPPSLTSDDQELTATWTKPQDNGSEIFDYDLEYRLSGAWIESPFIGSGLSAIISGLTNGATYSVRVRAENHVGESNWSPSSSIIVAGPPDKITTVISTDLNASLYIIWTAPDANGNAINDYDLRYRALGTSEWLDHHIAGTINNTTIDSLKNGITYQLQVRAWNDKGASEWSDIVTDTPRTSPDTPEAPQVFSGSSELGVIWKEPFNGGSPITDYNIRYKRPSVTNWTSFTHTGTNIYNIITSRTNNVELEVQIQAVNSLGSSGWSDSGLGTPQSGNSLLPDRPAAPNIIAGYTQLGVSWRHDSESIVNDYDVRYRLSSSSTWIDVPTAGVIPYVVITSLTNANRYRIQYRRNNVFGSSQWSPGKDGVPSALGKILEEQLPLRKYAYDRAPMKEGVVKKIKITVFEDI